MIISFFSSLIEYYLYTKFHRNRRNFLWTDGHTVGRTDANLTPILLSRFPKFGSRPNKLDGIIHRLTPKILQNFVLWWFYVRRQHTKSWTKLKYGKVSNFEDDFCRFASHFLTFLPRFCSYSISHESVTSDVESSPIHIYGYLYP